MLILNLLIGIIALMHLWFLVLEMFLWTKPIGLKIFHMSEEKAQHSKVLAANQGLYNGFLAAGLFYGILEPDPLCALKFKVFFLFCIVLAGLFGWATVSRKIFYFQGLPALILLVAVLLIGFL